ncbi:MAG TPA: hypothetical protein VG917_00130 [Patescibacteria group bacterium]|nr:hypothetical protein [Patescibacteria group bacterium]
MQSVNDVLKKFNPTTDKYISREFQSYGIYLSEELNDHKHKSLYIKLAKTVHRSILDKALSYCKDARTETPNKGALFMWKMKQLKNTYKENEAARIAKNLKRKNEE